MIRIAFDVAGLPRSQGALVRSPSGGLYNRGAKDLQAWRGAIATEARACIAADLTRWQIFNCPVEVRATFRLPRPLGHSGARGLRASAPAFPGRKPDLDKLARAALDALTGVVFLDDAQVVDLVVRKRYTDPGQQPGVSVEISERLA